MLNGKEIKSLIKKKKLIEGFIDQDVQLTSNGFDLTAGKVFEFAGKGELDFSNLERVLPETKEVRAKKKTKIDKYGWWNLKAGAYKIKTNESLNLPKNLTAVAFSRTSLLRMGAYVQTGVWDAGFKGKSEFVLRVENEKGIRVKQNARLAQIIFFRINEVKKGYSGIYKNLK